eukprot:scaffold244_cov416-Prasinococcus_capsulatus_cf.AAC.16
MRVQVRHLGDLSWLRQAGWWGARGGPRVHAGATSRRPGAAQTFPGNILVQQGLGHTSHTRRLRHSRGAPLQCVGDNGEAEGNAGSSGASSNGSHVDTEQQPHRDTSLDVLVLLLDNLPMDDMSISDLERTNELLSTALSQVQAHLHVQRAEAARVLANEPSVVGADDDMVLPRQLMRSFLESRINGIGRPAR